LSRKKILSVWKSLMGRKMGREICDFQAEKSQISRPLFEPNREFSSKNLLVS